MGVSEFGKALQGGQEYLLATLFLNTKIFSFGTWCHFILTKRSVKSKTGKFNGQMFEVESWVNL